MDKGMVCALFVELLFEILRSIKCFWDTLHSCRYAERWTKYLYRSLSENKLCIKVNTCTPIRNERILTYFTVASLCLHLLQFITWTFAQCWSYKIIFNTFLKEINCPTYCQPDVTQKRWQKAKYYTLILQFNPNINKCQIWPWQCPFMNLWQTNWLTKQPNNGLTNQPMHRVNREVNSTSQHLMLVTSIPSFSLPNYCQQFFSFKSLSISVNGLDKQLGKLTFEKFPAGDEAVTSLCVLFCVVGGRSLFSPEINLD